MRVRLRCLAITALCVIAATACAGEGAAPTLVQAEGADIDQSIQSESWQITLVGPPYKDDIVGDESEAGIGSISYYESGVREAEGIWLIVPARIANVGSDDDMIMPGKVKLVDGQGNEVPVADRMVHLSAIWIHDPDRWGSDDNWLLPVILEPEEAREGPVIFDVAPDATGLRLALEGTDETLDLGF